MRRLPTHAIRIVFFFAICACISAQNTGRFAALTSKGIELIDKGRYNEAINALEEVWELDQSDPAVAENLGLAYLYADRDSAKAQGLMETAIAGGGRASFVMQHAHEKVTAISMDTNDFCVGRLSIYKDRMTFKASNPDHSFTIQAGEFKEIKQNKWFGSGEGVYHIRTLGKRTYNLRPKTWSDRETKLVLYFIDKYIKR